MPFLNVDKIRLKSKLAVYQKSVNCLIESKFPLLCSRPELKEVCLYALQGEAKRFRPAITLMVAKLLDNGFDASFSALSIELFHTASLVADDLPCMDDDPIRRSKAALHIKYGTDVAILASYALIGAGYQAIFEQKSQLNGQLFDLDERALKALELLANNNGLDGAPLGQYLDLHTKDISKSALDDILYRKTVIFFETAFLFGWLFGGGDLAHFSKVKEIGYHFGMAFQIYDDFKDLEEDEAKGKVINYPLSLGIPDAKKALENHLLSCERLMRSVSLYRDELQELLVFIKESILNSR